MTKHTPQFAQPQLPFDEIPYGYCHCGCGQKTRLAPQSVTKTGLVKGQPMRYISGHNSPPTLRGSDNGRFRPVEDRFWAKVDKRGPDDCWLWTAHINQGGYGVFRTAAAGTVLILAHRFSFELHFGPIPKGIKVCHNCPNGDNPRCVNPAHLWLGTQADNIHDMLDKGREDFSGLEKGWSRKP